MLATLDLAFLPALAALLAPPLLRERNRNIAMLGVLTALWVADAAFLAACSGGNVELASRALLAAMNIALLLLTIIGGRIVPAFTGNALRRADASFTLHSYPWIERILPAAMLGVIVVDAWQPRKIIAGVLALAVAILQAWRLSGWRSLRTRGDPILWVLHVAYAWLPLGFALKAIARLDGRRVGPILAARARHRRAGDHDPGGDNPRLARTHRAATGRSPGDRHRVRAGDSGRIDPRGRTRSLAR